MRKNHAAARNEAGSKFGIEYFGEREKETQRAIDNIMDAMEKGIITSSTKSRLTKLEARLDEIEAKIITENAKEKASLKREDIIRYLKCAIKKDPKQMIRELVKRSSCMTKRYRYIITIRKTKEKTKGLTAEVPISPVAFTTKKKFLISGYINCGIIRTALYCKRNCIYRGILLGIISKKK